MTLPQLRRTKLPFAYYSVSNRFQSTTLGAVLALALSAWIGAGSYFHKTMDPPLPGPVYNCSLLFPDFHNGTLMAAAVREDRVQNGYDGNNLTTTTESPDSGKYEHQNCQSLTARSHNRSHSHTNIDLRALIP